MMNLSWGGFIQILLEGRFWKKAVVLICMFHSHCDESSNWMKVVRSLRRAFEFSGTPAASCSTTLRALPICHAASKCLRKYLQARAITWLWINRLHKSSVGFQRILMPNLGSAELWKIWKRSHWAGLTVKLFQAVPRCSNQCSNIRCIHIEI